MLWAVSPSSTGKININYSYLSFHIAFVAVRTHFLPRNVLFLPLPLAGHGGEQEKKSPSASCAAFFSRFAIGLWTNVVCRQSANKLSSLRS